MATEWKKVRLGEICDYVTSGGTPLASRNDYYNPPVIPWLKTKEVNYSRITKTENFISQKGLDNSSAKLIPENSVIIAMYGQGDTAGRVAINKIPLTTNQACCNFIIDKEKADYNFIYYQLCTLYDKMVSLKSGGAQPNLNAGKLKELEIALPPLEIQQKIAGILSAYDDLIENNRKQIKLLEEAAQKLYKEWFVKLNFPGHENVKIVDGIPEGWVYKKLDKVFNYVRGRSYSSDELSETKGTLFVNLKNIQAFGGYKRNAEKRYLGVYKTEQTITSGDIVLGVTDMTKERRLVGSVAQIPELGETATFTMDLIKLEPYEITKNFLYSSLRFGGISRQISPLANGVNVLHLKPEALNQVGMLIPDAKLIQHYDEFYEPIRLKIERVQKEIQLLQSARDKLLPRLMNGDINA